MDRIWRFYEPRVFGSHLFGVFAVEGVQETLDLLGDDLRIFPFPGMLQPCALVCGYVYMGKDCACLFVVLVLVFTAVHVRVRIRRMGKDCACLSVVLVLSAIARFGSGYVFVGRDCACLSVFLALGCQDVDMPVVVLDRCPVSTCRKLRSPAVAVRRSGRDVSVGQQRQVRTVLLCIRQLHGWCLLDS